MGEHRKNGDDKKLREKKFEAMYNEYGEYAYIIAYNIKEQTRRRGRSAGRFRQGVE